MDTIDLVNIKTKDIQPTLDSLMDQKRKHNLDYYYMIQQIIRGKSIDQSQYNRLLKSMFDIDQDMTELLDKSTPDKHYIIVGKQEKKAIIKSSSPKLPSQERITKLLKLNSAAIARAFRFKTVEECQSAKRSQPYYMSKEELLKAIETNDNIRKMMPKQYQSKKKEEICKSIFTLKNKN